MECAGFTAGKIISQAEKLLPQIGKLGPAHEIFGHMDVRVLLDLNLR